MRTHGNYSVTVWKKYRVNTLAVLCQYSFLFVKEKTRALVFYPMLNSYGITSQTKKKVLSGYGSISLKQLSAMKQSSRYNLLTLLFWKPESGEKA